MMDFRIETIAIKKLVGKKVIMSISSDRTRELWHSFMSGRKEIKNTIGHDLFNVKIYDLHFFDRFNPDTEFEKMAAVEVTDFDLVPEGMETFILTGGLYAVFNYKGSANEGAKAFQYIFGTWLPDFEYVLDNRPHFDLLGEKYKNDDPVSEEELWIPVKLK